MGNNAADFWKEPIKKHPSFEVLARARTPYAREYYDELLYEFDPLGGYRLRPNQRLPHVTINGYGYRGRPFDGGEKVLLLGDSVTFGVGASSDEAVFARFLERASGRPVADASVRAYRAFQHFEKLPHLLDWAPHVETVVLWFGYADLLFWVTTGGRVEGAFQFEWKYAKRRRFYQIFFPLQPVLPVPAREGSLEELVAHVGRYVRAIRDLCSSRNISLVVWVQPFLRAMPQETPLRSIMEQVEERTQRKFGRGWLDIAPRFVHALGEELRRCRANAFDAQALISERDFLDQVHLTEASLERLAQTLAGMHFHRPRGAAFHQIGEQVNG